MYCEDCERKAKRANKPHKTKQIGASEKRCPGGPGITCGNIIYFRTDRPEPKYCDECLGRDYEKKCSIPGCDHVIKYKLTYTKVHDVCGRCFKEKERGSESRLCDKCGNLMWVAKGKNFTTCRDCHQAEQSEKHEALRRSVIGKRLEIYASSIDSFAQSLPSYLASSSDTNLVLLNGSARQEWKMPPLKRGERVDGGFDRGNLAYNFPTIDLWDVKTGEATSIKSIDLGTQTYRNLNAMDRQIAGYIDELAKYKGTDGKPWGKVNIDPQEIKSRTLILVAPLITARDYQLNFLYSLPHNRYALEKEVHVVVFIVD